jgi:hypothetical protein
VPDREYLFIGPQGERRAATRLKGEDVNAPTTTTATDTARAMTIVLASLLWLAAPAVGDLETGLVAYYPFSGNANDISVNGQHGVVDGPTLTVDCTGMPNSAYLFTKCADLIELPNALLNGANDFTFSCMVRFDALDPARFPALISGAADGSNTNEILLEINDYTSCDNVVTWVHGSPSYSRATVSAGQWCLLTWVRFGAAGETRIFVNHNGPVSIPSSIGPLSISAGGLWLGNDQDLLGGGWEERNQFYGALDEVRIWNRALTAQEEAQIPFGGIMGYYPCNGNANDASGNARHGTVVGPIVTADCYGTPHSAYCFEHFRDLIGLPSALMDEANDFTFSCMARFDVLGIANYPSIISGANASDSNELLLEINDGTYPQHVVPRVHNAAVGTTAAVPVRQWCRLTWVRHSVSGECEIFVDHEVAAAVTSASGAVNIDSGGLWLGNDQDSFGGGWEESGQFYGALDEIRIWNRALTAAEEAQIPCPRLGDMNCDGYSDGFDIDLFFLALADPAAWQQQFPNCPLANGDINGDGYADGFDIDAFFDLLAG